MGHVPDRINMDEHTDPGYEQEPDAGEGIKEKSRIDLKFRCRTVLCKKVQVPGIGTEPGIDDLLKALVLMRVGPHVVLQDSPSGEQKRQYDYADADRADGLLGQFA